MPSPAAFPLPAFLALNAARSSLNLSSQIFSRTFISLWVWPAHWFRLLFFHFVLCSFLPESTGLLRDPQRSKVFCCVFVVCLFVLCFFLVMLSHGACPPFLCLSALHPYHFLEAQALGVLFGKLPHQPVFILSFSYCPCVPLLGCILPESKTGVSSFIPGA